jgi:hypothetical protein
LVHILEQTDFISVRTNRNLYKISPKQRDLLTSKKMGIVGLSVGQSIAHTAIQERIVGEVRIADLDNVELSNLNRLKAGLHQLGQTKVEIAAKSIWEMDPFIKIKFFKEGLNEKNIDDFLTGGGKLDVLIEECDGLGMKIIAREKAKAYQIPVIMDTNDRGMLDVERYDLDPDYPILHGLVGDLSVAKLKTLKTAEEKVPYLLPMIGIDDTSVDLRASMIEIENSIRSWPQLASSVSIGAGAAVDIARRILLGYQVKSGRYYFDIEDAVKHKPLPLDPLPEKRKIPNHSEKDKQAEHQKMLTYFGKTETEMPRPHLDAILDAAVHAPSTGNNQPWSFQYSNNVLSVFHHHERSNYFWDQTYFATNITFGMLLENIQIAAQSNGYDVKWSPFGKEDTLLVAAAQFSPAQNAISERTKWLGQNLLNRYTNRSIEPKIVPISNDEMEKSMAILADSDIVSHRFYSNPEDIEKIAEILGGFEKIRLTHPLGFQDFLQEVRWSASEAEEKRDGIDIHTVDLTEGETAGFKIMKDYRVFDKLMKVKGGSGFSKMLVKQAKNCSHIGYFTAPNWDRDTLLKAGMEMERHWIACNAEGLAYQPIASCNILQRYISGGYDGSIPKETFDEIQSLESQLHSFLKIEPGECPIFLYRLFKPSKNVIKSQRFKKDDIVTFVSIGQD